MNEKQLIAKCLKRDQNAMTVLFQKYAGALKTSCLRIVKDKFVADDIFQEGFLDIFNKLNTFQEKSSLYTWMNRIMVNKALMHVRKSNVIYTSLSISEFDDIPDEDSFSNEVISDLDALEAKEVLQLLMELPDKYSIVLNLYAIDGLKHSEISEQLGISIALSKKILSRARIKLLDLINTKKNENRRTGFAASK